MCAVRQEGANDMTKGLFAQAMLKLVLGVVMMGLLLFLPAGTLDYPGGWLMLGILFFPMLICGLALMLKNPALLKKRMNHREEQSGQRLVILLSGLMFLGGFIVAGLDFRFGWSALPVWIPVAACVVFLAGYALYAEVLRENAYLSRTVEIQENQKVVDTGLYGVVRHPMYSATILLFLSMPLILGSLVSFAVFLVYPFLIVMRIQNEEKLLAAGLDGYTNYQKTVKYRLLPLVW